MWYTITNMVYYTEVVVNMAALQNFWFRTKYSIPCGSERGEKADSTMRNSHLRKEFPFDYDRITERILAGECPCCTADVERLLKEGVTHILDLRQDEEWMSSWGACEAVALQAARGIQRKPLPILDFTPPLPKDFAAAVAFLEAVLQDPAAQVYVHCHAGMQRTPTILIAYFALQWGTSCAETLKRLAMARPVFEPMEEQMKAVECWLKGDQEH
jgi:protein-tyrosine phosphatase